VSIVRPRLAVLPRACDKRNAYRVHGTVLHLSASNHDRNHDWLSKPGEPCDVLAKRALRAGNYAGQRRLSCPAYPW
jgi:hypothetical protein